MRRRRAVPGSEGELEVFAAEIKAGAREALADDDRIFHETPARERARCQVRRLLDLEERGPAQIPDFQTLRERLARPAPAMRWRVEGMQTQGSRAILAAQYKAGKTTVADNLLRSLVDGDDFLGHRVAAVAGVVALLDFEMGERQLDAWFHAQRIAHDDRILALPLRGRATAFDILDAECRALWAARFRERGVQLCRPRLPAPDPRRFGLDDPVPEHLGAVLDDATRRRLDDVFIDRAGVRALLDGLEEARGVCADLLRQARASIDGVVGVLPSARGPLLTADFREVPRVEV